MSTRLLLLAACGLGVSTLAGCGKHGPSPAAAPAAQAGAAAVSSRRTFAGEFVNGADQAGIRAYLQSVRETKPTRFDVQWHPDTVPVSREEAARALRAISADGSEYSFSSSEPVVAKLTPGKIIWIWGIALRRIERVGTIEDTTVVRTRPVSLTEAFTRAEIEFDSPVNFGDAFGMRQPRPPAEAAPPARAAHALRHSPMQPVLYEPGNPQPGNPQPGNPQPGSPPENPPPPEDNTTSKGPDEDDLVGATADGFSGKVAGFEFSLGYRVSPKSLQFEIQGRKEEEGNGSGTSNEILRDQRDEYFEFVHEEREARKEAHEQFERLQTLNEDLKNIDTTLADVVHPPLDSARAIAGQQALERLEQQYGSTVMSKNEQALENLRADVLKQRQESVEKYQKSREKAEYDANKARALASAGALARQVFYIVSDNLDVRFRGKMDLRQASVHTALSLAGGQMTGATVSYKDLSGKIEIELVGRLGQGGNGGVSIPVAHVPVMMNIPVIIYGVPFVYQLGADFLVKLFLSGNHAAHHFVGAFEFNGGGGVVSTQTTTDANNSLSGEDPEVSEETAESPGTSGTVLGIQLPRLGLGLGLFGASAMSYIDFVNVLTITNSASVAALNPRCKKVTLDEVAHVGVDLNVMPIPIPLVENAASKALSGKKEIWHHHWNRVTPNIKMCQI